MVTPVPPVPQATPVPPVPPVPNMASDRADRLRHRAQAEPVAALLRDLWQAVPSLVGDRVELFSLEAIRAGRALAQIVALLAVAAVLGLTAWLAAWVGVGAGLVQLGLAWPWAVLAVVAANLLVCAWALTRMGRLAPLLALPATRRHLSFGRRASTAAQENAA